jgi:hypothetical protein
MLHTGTKAERLAKLIKTDWVPNQIEMFIGQELAFSAMDNPDDKFTLSMIKIEGMNETRTDIASYYQDKSWEILKSYLPEEEIETFDDVEKDPELKRIIELGRQLKESLLNKVMELANEQVTASEAYDAYRKFYNEKMVGFKKETEPTREGDQIMRT